MQLVPEGKTSATAFGITLFNLNLMFHNCNRKELSTLHIGYCAESLYGKTDSKRLFVPEINAQCVTALCFETQFPTAEHMMDVSLGLFDELIESCAPSSTRLNAANDGLLSANRTNAPAAHLTGKSALGVAKENCSISRAPCT